jgi:DNA-binding NtrC family response regulator
MTKTGERILLVEDERAQREALAECLAWEGHEVDAVATGEEAIDRLEKVTYSLLLTDLRLPGLDGLAVVRRARAIDEELGVLLMTAFASVESAVEALRIGAHDYLLKPLILEEVSRKVDGLLAHRNLVRENAVLRRALQGKEGDGEMVAVSTAMQEVMTWVRRAARSRATVLITGETGTGKEVVARAIHRMGNEGGEPFLAVNLAAVPENMVESELFGHEKGAFTGADRRREGILRAAGKGTVFLDEIAELAPGPQAKLLRALEAREVQPLGRDTAVPFEARIVAATHRDLESAVESGRFREDLYYRLNVVRMRVPALRERPDDVPALARHLLARHAERAGIPTPVICADAMRCLCAHPWRGNVREMANVLERALILADDGRIDLEHLPDDVRDADAGKLGLADAVDRFEKSHIALVLRLCGGNREKAAAELGVSPATLYRRIERHGLKGFETGGGRVDPAEPDERVAS